MNRRRIKFAIRVIDETQELGAVTEKGEVDLCTNLIAPAVSWMV
jgi:hypothetical protein